MKLRDVNRRIYDNKSKILDRELKYKKPKSKSNFNWDSLDDTPKESNFLVYLFIISILFFLLSIGIAFFLKQFGVDKTISTEKIDLLISGNSVVKQDAIVPLSIKIVNRNPVMITDSDLIIEYPAGSYDVKNKTDLGNIIVKELKIGKIGKADFREVNIENVFLGLERDVKEVNFIYEYRLEGSRSIFQNKQTYKIQLQSSPVNIQIEDFGTIITGKKASFTASIISNSTRAFPELYVKATYPNGFRVESSNIKNYGDTNNEWLLKNFLPGETRDITINGVIQEKEGISRSIRFDVFVLPARGKKEDATHVAQNHEIVFIGKTFIDINTSYSNLIDNTFSQGSSIITNIDWANISGIQLENLTITVRLGGSGLDETKIGINGNSIYNVLTKTVVWSPQNIERLKEIDINEKGKLKFVFGVLPAIQELQLENKELSIAVSVMANRKDGTIEKVEDLVIDTFKVSSLVELSSKALHTVGSLIDNVGPIPPVSSKQTTYSINYLIKNIGNDLQDINIKIPLRGNIRYTGAFAGIESDEFKYDKNKNELNISIDEISALGLNSSRDISFQVLVQPGIADIGRNIKLTNNATFIAKDVFLDKNYNLIFSSINNILSSGEGGLSSGAVLSKKITLEELKERINNQ